MNSRSNLVFYYKSVCREIGWIERGIKASPERLAVLLGLKLQLESELALGLKRKSA